MKLLGSPILTIIVALIFSYFMLRYWKLLSCNLKRYLYLLVTLRIFSLLCLLFLLINPWVGWTKTEQIPQEVAVICDLSDSMFSHLEGYPLNYDQIQKKIKIWGEKSELKLNFFHLGRKIKKLSHIKSADLITDFRAIPDFISFEQPHQTLLITDGKATVGKNINDIEFDLTHPIHTVGVGPINIDQDIEIQEVILPDLLARGDTINIKIIIQSRIQNTVQSDFQIINEVGNKIYYKRMLFEQGNRVKELTLKIPTDVLNGLNEANIIPVKDETQVDNNTFIFRGNLQSTVDDLLLISGALSQNSRMIKEIMNGIENTNVHHFFRLNSTRWNAVPLEIKYSNLKMIVLDDFPILNGDSQLYWEIVELSNNEQIPVIYMQGPWCNLTSSEMIRSAYPDFIPKPEDSDMLMDISTKISWLGTSSIDLDQLPPQKRSIKWKQNGKPWYLYLDESILIGNHNNFYLVALPALAESHVKISINSQSIIVQLLRQVFLHAFHGSGGLLNLEVKKKSLNKGEIVQILFTHIKEIDLSGFSVHAVNESDTLQLECTKIEWDDDMWCSKSLVIPGEYIFYGEASLPGGEKVYSRSKSAIVQDIQAEMKELLQEHQALKEISYNTGGTYASIDSLDTMLAHIDITPIQRIKNHQFSSFSIHNYWWILIFLFSNEWYFRKKLGLL